MMGQLLTSFVCTLNWNFEEYSSNKFMLLEICKFKNKIA